jgi:hypothetical protein
MAKDDRAGPVAGKDKAHEGLGKRTIDRKEQAEDPRVRHIQPPLKGLAAQGADKLRNLFRGNRGRG